MLLAKAVFPEHTRLDEQTAATAADVRSSLALALEEFSPSWTLVGECPAVDVFDPSHWPAGTQSFQVTLRHRVTGRLKILGRRIVDPPSTDCHRGVALSLVETYRQGNAAPLRRYLEDVGVLGHAAPEAALFFRRPAFATLEAPPDPGIESDAYRTTSALAPTTPATSEERVPRVLLAAVSSAVRREFALWQWRRAYARQAATKSAGAKLADR